MRRLLLSLLLLLTLVKPAIAANTHANPNLPELGAWFGDGFPAYVVSGCLPTVPGASLTLAAFACAGYVDGAAGDLVYTSQAAATVTLANTNGEHWLALHRDTSTAVGGWTRRAGSHYLFQQAATLPAEPSGGLIVARVTVAASVITAVLDLRRLRPDLAPAIYAESYGMRCDGSTDNSTPLVNALAAAARWGGKVILPGSRFTCNYATGLVITQSWLILEGQGSGWSDTISGAAPTILKYTGAGNAITLGDGVVPVTNVILRDFDLLGSGSAQHGVYLRGDTANKYVLRTLFQRLYISGFTATNRAGFFHEGGIENTLDHVYLYNNYIGLKISSLLGGATTTTFLCQTCIIRVSTAQGVLITGTTTFSHLVFDQMSIFESNGTEGIYVNSANTGYVYGLTVNNSYFENNNTAGGSWQFETRGTATQYVRNVSITNTVFVNPAGAGGDINLEGTIDSIIRNVRGGAGVGKAIYHQEANASAILAEGIETANGGAVDVEGRLAWYLPYDATGRPKSQGGYREFGRTAILGAYTTPTFNAADFTAAGGQTWTLAAGDVSVFAYALVGKTMSLSFLFRTTSVSGATATLYVAIPGGYTAAKEALNPTYTNDNGTVAIGYAYVAASGTTVQFYKDVASANWAAAANTTGIQGQITFEVQ